MNKDLSAFNEKEILELFKKFLRPKVEHESTVKLYVDAIKNHVVPKFIGPGEGGVKKLFLLPVEEIEKFYKSCKKRGDNHDWSMSLGRGAPSAALGQIKRIYRKSRS